MEPQIPTPNTTPEMGGFMGAPHSPEGPRLPSPEAQKMPQWQVEREGKVESREQVSGAGVGDVAPAQVSGPQMAHPSVVTAPAAPQDDTPLVAADEDLIEMEWVNKAKKIVNDTKSDPYLQEKEVSRLQASYLQKRYGKEVKVPQDE